MMPSRTPILLLVAAIALAGCGRHESAASHKSHKGFSKGEDVRHPLHGVSSVWHAVQVPSDLHITNFMLVSPFAKGRLRVLIGSKDPGYRLLEVQPHCPAAGYGILGASVSKDDRIVPEATARYDPVVRRILDAAPLCAKGPDLVSGDYAAALKAGRAALAKETAQVMSHKVSDEIPPEIRRMIAEGKIKPAPDARR